MSYWYGILLLLLLSNSVYGQCPDVEIISLQNVPGYPQLDNVNVCGESDTLSFVVYSGDPGRIVGYELQLNLPEGLKYDDFEFTTFGGTSISNVNPDPSRPQFILEDFQADSLVVANIGIKANCNVNFSEILLIEYEFNYTHIDEMGNLSSCEEIFVGETEYNTGVKLPVINILEGFTPQDVDVTALETDFCQTINISQDGISAALDEFLFEIVGLDLSGPVSISSITANNVHSVSYNYDMATMTTNASITGDMFVGNSIPNPDDAQFNTSEVLELEICYSVDVCPIDNSFTFDYIASFGCNNEVCQISRKQNILNIVPTGSQSPVATTQLITAPELCGTDGEISLTVNNPNVPAEANNYTDLIVGFETCEKANLELSQISINGIDLPVNTFGWVNDDLNIDFSALDIGNDIDGPGGLEDLDGDGIFDDLAAGSTISLSVFLTTICGVDEPDPSSGVCPANSCSFSQFYVNAKTNCGTEFNVFPPITNSFDISYGPSAISNPNEYGIPIANPALDGYDFGVFGSTGSSTQEIEFCYDFSQENFTGCANSDVDFQITFAGDEGYIYDIDILSVELSEDGGATYSTSANLATDSSWISLGEEKRQFNVTLGSNATNVCYKYVIEMDSVWCPAPAYWFGSQQVIERCNDGGCGGSCDIVRACRSVNFYGDANASNCACVLEGDVRELYRKNYGFTDASMTNQLTRNDVSLADQTRFLPGDTMILDYYYIITDDYAVENLDIARISFGLWFRGNSINGASVSRAELLPNLESASIKEMSIQKPGVTYENRIVVDIASISECGGNGIVNTGSIEGFENSAPICANSSNDLFDGTFVNYTFNNWGKISDCNGSLIEGGNCIDELFEMTNYQAGDTIRFKYQVEMMKNPNRVAREEAGIDPGPSSQNHLISISSFIDFIDPNGGVFCNTRYGNDCAVNPVFAGACPGEITSQSDITLDACGGTIEHSFYMNPTIPLDWFSDEFRPVYQIDEIRDPIYSPMAFCGNGEVINYNNGIPSSLPITPESVDNMICVPVVGYTDDLCAIDNGDTAELIWNPKNAGAKALGIGNVAQDSLKIQYDFCLLCPEPITATDHQIFYDYSLLTEAGFDNCHYRCAPNAGAICTDLGLVTNDNWAANIEDALFKSLDNAGPNLAIIDNRTPLQNVNTNLGAGASPLVASVTPVISEEIQAIDICNPNTGDPANGLGATVTIPLSISLVNVYSDAMGTTVLPTTLITDDGNNKTYNIDLGITSLAASDCTTIYIGTTLLFCPTEEEPPATVCVAGISGCAPIEVMTALSTGEGCGNNQICYTYITGEVGLQTEWFDLPASSSLCEEFVMNVLVKNVKETTLLDILSSFEIPNGMTVIPNSWEVAYPGGPTTIGAWTAVPDPDVVVGKTYSYSDDAIWSIPAGTPIHLTGLEGISLANTTADNNKISFRFKVTTDCDEFLSGSTAKTITTASNPCEDELVSTGIAISSKIIVDGADPEDFAQLIVIAEPEELNCNASNNTFGISAINTSAFPTSDDVTTCITIPEGLTFVSNSVNITQPVSYTIANITTTPIGNELEVCFDSPQIGVSQAMKFTFDAVVDLAMECGDLSMGVDIKSRVESVACSPGPPTACDVFVQNSINPEATLEILPPFIAENWNVYSECATTGNVSLFYEYAINHNGPDATNQPYTVDVYKDINGDEVINYGVDELLGTHSSNFSVVDGASILVSGNIEVANENSCPILMEVSYGSTCACDTQEKYFDNIKLKSLREFIAPISMCPGTCLDVEICDFVSIKSDSIPSASGAVYDLSFDWGPESTYSLPSPGGILPNITYEGFNDGSLANDTTNLLMPEQSFNISGWIVADFGKPHHVSQITIGGGTVSGWTFANGLQVYQGTAYVLEYSDDGNIWLDSGMTFNGGSSNTALDINILPAPITAQYWRMSSDGISNWGVGEWSFQGESIPFQGTQPVSQSGNTVSICLPEGVGINAPWSVDFTTGTGDCEVTESIEIWNSGNERITLGEDLILCGNDCVDLEVILEGEGSLENATAIWTPATGLSDPTALDPEVCMLTTDMTYIVDVTFPGGCVKSDTITIDHLSEPTISSSTLATICELGGGEIEGQAGYNEYTWFEVIGGTEIQVAFTMSNVYNAFHGGTYIWKAFDGVSPCPVEIGEVMVLEEDCKYNVGNYVWIDEDGDSDQDAGESGIPGVVVYLLDDSGMIIDSTITDFNGGYLFEDVLPGNYTVEVNASTLPTDLDFETFDNDGGLDGTTNLTIVDEDNLEIDFGYNYKPAKATNNPPVAGIGAIGNRIWSDSNGDGVEDPNEVGISGVVVNLLDENGVVIATTTTDAAGFYIFDNLPAGVYSVGVDDSTLPIGFVTTPTGDPDADGDNISTSIVLAPGDVYLDMDFGYNNPTGHAVGDQLYLDANANGFEDPSELPIEGVTIALIDDANGNGIWDQGELPIATTKTDANGQYLFDGLSDGNYIVAITDTDNVLNDLEITGDPDGGLNEISAVTIAGADDFDQDFGYTPEGHMMGDGMLGDFIFLDVNGDGTQDSSDSGLEGVVVNLYDGMGNFIATTTTDANGKYLFGGLDADTYTVEVDPTTLPNDGVGLAQSVDADGGNDNQSVITLAQGEVNLDQDFGYLAPIPNTIGGTIWEDVDANGTLDESAILFEGVTVVLYDDHGNVIATTLTDVNGEYEFTGLPDGTYTVDVTDDAGVLGDYWKSNGTNPGADNNSQIDTNTVSVAGGTSDTTSDFGYYNQPAALGNYVWEDLNSDGIQDAIEPPIVGAVVELNITYSNGATITVTETTDANGFYSFDNLLLDEDYNMSGGGAMPIFELSVTAPTDFIATVIDVNGNANDFEDSEDPTGVLAITTQGSNDTAANVDPNMENPIASYDFGFIELETFSVGNYVWLDEDGDGDQNAGEAGIGGATVNLLDDMGNIIATTITDFEGGYLFEGVLPGTYTVSVNPTTLPAGLNNQTFDLDGILNNESPVTVIDENVEDIDFGYNYAPPVDTNNPSGSLGAIGDFVWSDANGDGVQDPGESGIEGVVVNLIDADGNIIGTKTTDASGHYIFDNLPAGVYSVEVDETTLPVGFITSPTGDPDSDGNNLSEPIVLGPGDVYLDLDFGYNDPTAHAIGDQIYFDINADGMFDMTDLPIPGVTVALIDDANGNGVWDQGELPLATTTTDANGIYLFPGLQDGNYIVAVTDTENVTDGLTNSGDPDGGLDETSFVTLAGADNLDQDFGYIPDNHTSTAGLIGDFIFLDANGDDAYTIGESGIENVKVDLFDSSGNLVATTRTDPNGQYLFGGLDADTYTIKVDPTTLPGSASIPAGLTASVDPDGGTPNESTTTIAQGGIDLDQDFGYKAIFPNTIGGTIWEDIDANGILDDGTILFDGITVVLYDDQGNVVGMTTTDLNGEYTFEGLPDGTYSIEVTDDNGILGDYWKSQGGLPGTDNNSQPEDLTVSVFGGQTNTTSDFGYYQAGASIGNYIWSDDNGDGIQTAGEAGLSGVLVSLTITYPDGTIVNLTTTTDATGHYSFDNLLLDEDYNTGNGGAMPTYEVSATTPLGYNISPIDVNANSNDLEDSEDPAGVVAVPIQGQQNTTQNTTPTLEMQIASYDFGFVPIALPVTLREFKATVVDCNAEITWTAESESKFSHYELEYSDDQGAFELIEKFESAQSTETISYFFTDYVNKKQNYYRLKMVDLDGSFAYSNIVSANVDCNHINSLDLKLFPNPITVTDALNVTFNSNFNKDAQVKIFDQSGKLVFTTKLTTSIGGNHFTMNLPDFPFGEYIFTVEIEETGTVQSIPFIKIR